jgi:hypothetical protein
MARQPKPVDELSPAYRRRIERGMGRGMTRSEARGHPRVGESRATWRPSKANPPLEEGLHRMRDGQSLTQAARSIHVTPERLRNYLDRMGVVEKRGNRWRPGTDIRERHVQIVTQGEPKLIVVRGYEASKLAGDYREAVHRFLDTGDESYLQPFKGKTITDISGTTYELETDENELYTASETGAPSFEDVYRIVA